jgi:hypothetical protein
MPPVRVVLAVGAVSLMLTSSASEAGTVGARSASRTVHPNRVVVGAPFVVREPFISRELSVFPRPVDPWRFWPPGTVATRHGVSPFGSSLVFPGTIGSGVVVATTPSYVYDQAPVVTGGTASVPTVVEYPTGWYQLRGDGVTAPYVWVWIPKPPPAPSQPPAVIPPVPPPPVGSLTPEGGSDQSPRRKGLFRWIDEEGIAHWTDQRESIPQRYRAQAESR